MSDNGPIIGLLIGTWVCVLFILMKVKEINARLKVIESHLGIEEKQ